MDTNKEILQGQLHELYNAALNKGLVHSITDFAQLLNRDKSGVINALNGNERYLTDKLE